MTDATSAPDGLRALGPAGPIRSRRTLAAVGRWLGMVVLAIPNATVRELFVTPQVGEYPAHVFSTATLLIALAVVLVLYVRRRQDHTDAELAAVGVLRAGLRVAFELLFGHYVAGESWAALFTLYDETAGRMWVVVLVGPWVVGRYLRRRSPCGEAGTWKVLRPELGYVRVRARVV